MVEALCAPSGAVAEAASSADPVLAAYDHVADVLGNTRPVARDSYVAPAVERAHREGALQDLWASSRSSSQRTRAESTLDKVFDRAPY
jgi:DNA topoisomerase IB